MPTCHHPTIHPLPHGGSAASFNPKKHRSIRTKWLALLLAGAVLVARPCQAHPSVLVTNQTPGATPFINLLTLTVDDPAGLDYVAFTVQSKPGSVVRPVSARYSAAYLRGRGYVDATAGTVTVPVFGLYAKYTNTVNLQTVFLNGYTQQSVVTVATPVYKHDVHNHPEVLLARTADTTLSFDYMLVKAYGNAFGPIILDTDGEVRWVNPSTVPGYQNLFGLPAIFYQNGVYTPVNNLVQRVELDGASALIGNYADQGAVAFHHNMDVGRDGIIVAVDTTDYLECTCLEINPVSGETLRKWDLAAIISAAMTAGGDDPTQFVKARPDDWFHNNAATYRPADNTVIFSSRENFVIALDYDTQEIKWILGDPTKYWYTFPSLRKYALTLPKGTQPPIGQHSLSVVRDRLLLFDDGLGSLNQPIPGKTRTVSVCRKYEIDTTANTATQTFRYENDPPIFSSLCSSIYEDQPRNFLIDYSNILPGMLTELVGLNAAGEKVFDYRYQDTMNCVQGWNSNPIHLENLVFN